MADVPLFVAIGDVVPSGAVRAALPRGYLEGPDASELDFYNASALGSGIVDPRLDWAVRHTSHLGDASPDTFEPAFIYNHVGNSVTITAIADNGDGTTRVTVPGGHGVSSGRFPVEIRGITVVSGPDPNVGKVVGTVVTATTFDVPVVTAGGSYTYGTALIPASGGRTIEFFYHADGGSAARIVASSGDFVADGFEVGQRFGALNTDELRNQYLYWTIASVSTLTIELENAVNGPISSGPHSTSAVQIQGYATAAVASLDLYVSPLAAQAGTLAPNGQTDRVGFGQYPSEQQGFEGPFFAGLLDRYYANRDPDTGLAIDTADPWGPGQLYQNANLVAVTSAYSSLMPHDVVSLGIVAITPNGAVAELTLAEAHGIASTDKGWVSGLPGDVDDFSGYYTLTRVDDLTVSVPVTVADGDSASGTGTIGTVSLREFPIIRGDIVGDTLELSLGHKFDQAWSVDDSLSTFVDETTDLASAATGDVLPFPASEAVDDWFAAGFRKTFDAAYFDTGTVGIGGTVAWEYWDGAAWAALAGVTDDSTGFTVSGMQRVSWTVPNDWAPVALNAEGAARYYVRARVTGVYSTNPVLDQGWAAVDHTMSTDDDVWLGGVTGHTPEEVPGHWIITKLDDSRFSVPLKTTTVSTTIADGFAFKRPFTAQAFRVGEGRNGGSVFDRFMLAVEGALRQIAATGNTGFIAGIIFNTGYNDLGIEYGTTLDTNAQINRFGRHFGEFMRQCRKEVYDLSVTIGSTLHTDESDVPVFVVKFATSLESDDGITTLGGYLLPTVLQIREQHNIAYGEIAGRLCEIDPVAERIPRRIPEEFFFTGVGNTLVAEELAREVLSAIDGNAVVPATEGQVVNLIAYFGQSQSTGTTPGLDLYLGRDPNLDARWMDPGTGDVIPGRERGIHIWHHSQKRPVEFASNIGGLAGNSNTHPLYNASAFTFYGADVSMLPALREYFPSDGELVCFKLASPGAALAPVPGIPGGSFDPDSGALYQAIVDAWRELREYYADRGKIVRLRLIVWDQGEGDTATEWAGGYAARLAAFRDQLELDIGTQAEGEPKTPFAIMRLQDHDRQTFDAAGVAAIRSAQDAYANADPQAVSIDIDSCQISSYADDGTPEDVHRTGRGNVEAGFLVVPALSGIASLNLTRQIDLGLKAQEYGIPALGGQLQGAEVEGATEVEANTSTLSGVDPAAIIAAIDAALLEDPGALAFTVNGQTYTRRSAEDLLRLREYYATRALSGNTSRRRVVTFGRC